MTRWLTPVLAAALLAAGCSSTLLSSGATDPQEIAEIKSRILELQRAAAMTQVEIDRLRQQLVALESRLAGGAPPPAGRTAPPVVAPVPEPSVEAPAPIESSDLEPPSPATPSPRPRELPQDARPLPMPRPAEPLPRQEPAAEEPLNGSAQALYDRGYTLYHQGRYVDAEASFRRFLQAHPDSSLADNAQYWIGESRFARGDYEAALAAFEEGVARYPGGNKVADSLLKAADCQSRLGELGLARGLYDEVVRRFPGSAAAAIAEERRSGLGRGGG